MQSLIRITIVLVSLSLGAVALSGCEAQQADTGAEQAVVDSGTYTGTIKEVNADKKEIYVDADGTEMELYFIEETKLTKGGEAVEFSTLEKGQKVEVEVKKVGKRLDPLSVTIVE